MERDARPRQTGRFAEDFHRPSRKDDTKVSDLGAVAESDILWTIDDVARFLGIPKGTIYKWQTSDKGPVPVPLGKHLRWMPDDVREYLRELQRLRSAGERNPQAYLDWGRQEQLKQARERRGAK